MWKLLRSLIPTVWNGDKRYYNRDQAVIDLWLLFMGIGIGFVGAATMFIVLRWVTIAWYGS